MSEYTPTTDDDAESFMCLAVLGAQKCCAHCKSRFTEEKFKSWLTEVERAAAEKAWDEGEQAGYEDALGEQRGIRPNESARNPHRREEA